MRLSQGETTSTEAIVVTLKATSLRGRPRWRRSRRLPHDRHRRQRSWSGSRSWGRWALERMANALFEAGLSTHRFAPG